MKGFNHKDKNEATPETDADVAKVSIHCECRHCEVWAWKDGDTIDVVDADFTRKLERDLNKANSEIENLIDQRDAALSILNSYRK
jgi:hypothetical protein